MNISRMLFGFGFGSAFFNRTVQIQRVRSVFAASYLPDRSVFYFGVHGRFFSNRTSRRLTMSKPDKKQSGKFFKGLGFGGESRSHGTRSAVLEDEIQAEKEKYASMPIEKKRKLYKCGESNYTTLKDIVIWPKYEVEVKKGETPGKKSSKTFASDRARVHSHYKAPKFAVNDKLNRKISLFRGDITTLEIDAIVNAANNSLLGGGGVDGAIHNAAGGFLRKECSSLHGCDTGDAKITCGYKLPAKHIIHTVGPIGTKPDALHSAYRRSLEVLKKNGLTTVAFPCISTGIYGYPVEAATHVALETIRTFLETDPYSDKVERIILCVFLKKDVEVYEELLQVYFPLTDNNGKGKKADAEDASDTSSQKSREEGKDSPHGTVTAAESPSGAGKSTSGKEEAMEGDAREKGDPIPSRTGEGQQRAEQMDSDMQQKEEEKEEREREEKGKGNKRKNKAEMKDKDGEEESDKTDGKRLTKL